MKTVHHCGNARIGVFRQSRDNLIHTFSSAWAIDVGWHPSPDTSDRADQTPTPDFDWEARFD